jgi:outer membrane protein OmpA-like peptidoglycan-associated protein
MKNKITFMWLNCIVVVVCTLSAGAQSMNKLASGIMLGGALNMHNGVLTTNEGVLDCGIFDGTTSLRWLAGNYAMIPLDEKWALSPRLYYHKANGTFEANNPVSPLIALSNGTTVPLTTTHTLDVSLDYLTLDALAQYFITDQLYGGLGVSVGLATRNAFEQNENIISPQGATFLDGSTTRRIVAGNFTDKQGAIASNSIRLAAVANIGMMIPLSRSFILNPEVSFQYSFLNVITDADWKVHAARGSIGLMYVLETNENKMPEPPPAPPAQPIILPPPVAAIAPAVAMLDIQNVNSDGSAENYAELTINQHRTLDILPLLPYIFFEAETDVMINRYHRLTSATAAGFSEADLPNNQLEVYYDLLNIIGARMKKYPEATLTLTGCVEPQDDGNLPQLAGKRAEVTRAYLHDVYGIANERMTIQSRQLPQIMSNRGVAEGRAENRRVEITTNDQRILAPVFARNARATVTPNALRLNPSVIYQGNIRSVDYSLTDNSGRQIASASGGRTEAVTMNTSSMNLADVKSNQTLRMKMNVTDDSGKVIAVERTVPVRRTFTSSRGNAQIVRDTLIERYSLILFNFDRASTISGENDQIMRLIRSRVRTNSDVRVDGMTDAIGREESNKRLSESRAKVVQDDINAFIKPEKLTSNGLGEVTLFNNELPEGRFYNRRVFVEIATPLNPDLDEEGALK